MWEFLEKNKVVRSIDYQYEAKTIYLYADYHRNYRNVDKFHPPAKFMNEISVYDWVRAQWNPLQVLTKELLVTCKLEGPVIYPGMP